jgi:hypothetical protein
MTKSRKMFLSHNWMCKQVEGTNYGKWVCSSCDLEQVSYNESPSKCDSWWRFFVPARNALVLLARRVRLVIGA